jgi:hypothetical protein
MRPRRRAARNLPPAHSQTAKEYIDIAGHIYIWCGDSPLTIATRYYPLAGNWQAQIDQRKPNVALK